MRKSILFTATATIVAAVLISGPSVAADNDSADAGMGMCLINGGDSNWGTGTEADTNCAGAICYCCKSDGCYICDNTGWDCVWDPKARGRGIKQRLKAQLNLPTAKPTSVNPGLSTRPPRIRALESGLLEGGSGLPTLGPAPTGRPVAPPPPVQLR